MNKIGCCCDYAAVFLQKNFTFEREYDKMAKYDL